MFHSWPLPNKVLLCPCKFYKLLRRIRIVIQNYKIRASLCFSGSQVESKVSEVYRLSCSVYICLLPSMHVNRDLDPFISKVSLLRLTTWKHYLCFHKGIEILIFQMFDIPLYTLLPWILFLSQWTYLLLYRISHVHLYEKGPSLTSIPKAIFSKQYKMERSQTTLK